MWTAAGLRERGKESYKEECVHVRACMHVCVCISFLHTRTTRPAGGKVVCLPGREYGNDISHEVSGTNIWKGSFGEEAGDRF